MMNAYFFQMNNLKGLAADESGSSALVERLARSDGFTARFSVGWTSSAQREKTEEVVRTTVYHIGLELVKFTLKLEARFQCKTKTSNQSKNRSARGQSACATAI